MYMQGHMCSKTSKRMSKSIMRSVCSKEACKINEIKPEMLQVASPTITHSLVKKLPFFLAEEKMFIMKIMNMYFSSYLGLIGTLTTILSTTTFFFSYTFFLQL